MGGLGDVRVMWRKMLRIEDYKGGGGSEVTQGKGVWGGVKVQ